MTTYKELLAQRAELEAKIQEARKAELSEAVAKVRALVAEYELSADDIFGKAKQGKSSGEGAKVAPKYKNPATGETWTGRGKPPVWIRDKDRVQFEI